MPLFFDGSTSRESENLAGDRCWTLAHNHSFKPGTFNSPDDLFVLGDSGAFSHSPTKRWSFEEHVEKLGNWERRFAQSQGWKQWNFSVIASYDLLIDEVWVDDFRQKQRWSVVEAERAVNQTVAAAQYLNLQRKTLQPRILLLGCQGVNAAQYRRCVERVLEVAAPGDWIGFGGWCILGHLKFKHYLFEFFKVLNECVELVARAKIKHIHLFGVRYEPAVAAMQWTCDRYGISCSTDSSRFLLDCCVPTPSALKKSGAREPYWRDNVDWWKAHLANLNRSPYYRKPSEQMAKDALQQDAFLGTEPRKFLKERFGNSTIESSRMLFSTISELSG
jgi:hypothetical protein